MNNDKKIQSSAKSKSFMRRCLALLTCIGMLGSFMMPYQGVLPVIAEDGDAETVTPDLVCGLEEHTHTEECYSLICTDDSEGHEHNETCYELVCGLEEHQHDNNCYETVEDISDESLDVSTASTKNVILAKAGGFDGKKSTKKQPSTRTDNNNNLVNATGGSSYFTETVNEVGPSTREVKDSEIQNVTVTIQGTPYSAPDKDGNDVIVTLGEMNQDAVEANFSIQYMISKNEDGSYPVNVDSPCIYYQLPDGVKVPEEYYGRTRYVSDPNYNGPNGHVSGYFSINESGLIVIQFTEDYIKNKIMLSDFFEGSIKFDGTINRDETQSGDREIAVGGLALQIPYTDKTSKVEKTSTGTRTTSEGMEIDWQIKVKNVTTPADISGYLLKDSMFKDVAVTFEPSDAGSFNSDGDFVFDDAANYVPEITFTYTQTVASEDINQAMLNDTDAWSNQFIISKNTAQLINGEQEVSSGEKTIYGNKPYLEKEGEESYKNGQWIKSTIYWSIDVKAPDGDDLNGYYIIDDALNTSIEQANKLKTDELKDANGHVNSVVLTSNGEPLTAGTHYTYDATSGKITFTGTYTEVNIAYVTNCHDVEKDSDNKRNVRNDVSLYHPDKPDAPIKTDGTDVSFDNSTYRYGKNASFNYDENKITWEVSGTVLNPANDHIYLNNPDVQFYLKDESFKTVGLDKLTLKSANWKNEVYDFTLDATHAKDAGSPYLLIKKGDNIYGKVQYKSGTNDTLEIVDVVPDGQNSTPYHLSAVSFLYTIDVSGDDAKPANGSTIEKDGMTISANADGSVITYQNALGNGLSVEDGDYKGVIGEFRKEVRSTIGKSLSDVTGTSSTLGRDVGWYYGEDWNSHGEPEYKQLSWTVNLVQDEGFKNGSVFTDTLKSSDSSVQHIFGESLLNLQITLKTKETGGTEISGSNVKYTSSIDGNNLNVTFSEDYSAYKYATITYNSKAMVSQIKGTEPDWATAENRFYNEAEYANHTASNSYTYQNKNPEYIEKFDLSLKKTWNDTDTTKRPDSIQFRLLRKDNSASIAKADRKWKYITYDSSTLAWVEHEEEGTLTDDTLYLFSAYRTKNYAYTFSNLPKDTTTHDGDYEYKIEELPVAAYSTSYQSGFASYSSRSYEVFNTRENSIQKYVLDKDGNKVESGKLPLDSIRLVTLNQTHYYVDTGNEFEWYYNDNKEYPNYELISKATGHDKETSYRGNGDKVSNLKSHSGEYYIIQYEIDVDILDSLGTHVITDRIPEDSILIYDRDSTYEYQPVIIGSPDYKMAVNGNSEYHGLYAGDLLQEIRFTGMDKDIKGFKYYIGIPRADLESAVDGTVSVSEILNNTATLDGDSPVENSVTITKSKTDHEDNSLIAKDVATPLVDDGGVVRNATDQELKYQILVNPEKKKLAATNKAFYDITDVLNITPKNVDVDIVSVTATEINLNNAVKDANGRYVIDPNTYTVVSEEPVTYSYVSGDDSVTASDVTNEYIFNQKDDEKNEDGNMASYYQTERKALIPSGDEVVLIIEGGICSTQLSNVKNSLATYALATISYRSSSEGNASSNLISTLNPLPSSEYVKSWQFDEETGNYQIKVKLKDIPANATDIQVRRNGYQGAGITSVTVESATRYKTNDQGELVMTVPDSKALLIEYTYKVDNLEFDNNAASIVVTNEASIDTGNFSAWDKEDGTQFEVSQAQAFSGAQNEVKLVKRDINDYNLKIEADFYVAYYDGTNSKWVFSSQNTSSPHGTYSITSFNFGDISTAGNEIPSGAKKFSVDGINHIILSQNNAVYKFIEVPTTAGYLGTDISFPVTYKPASSDEAITFNTFDELVSDYLEHEEERSSDRNYPFRTFFNTYVPVHYFSYGNKDDISYPSGVERELIKNVSVGDNLNIDNTKVLSVKAEKNWNGGTWPDDATALLKLYYSERKITDGTFPDSLKEASASALGILDSNFKSSISLSSGMQSYTWTNLPTSINDKRIYYYVREESYSVKNEAGDKLITYQLQDDGSYSDGIKKGIYAPNYDGNGISRSDGNATSSIVTISNTSGLFLKKIWLDYYGGEIDASSEELPDSIEVKLQGKRATTGVEEQLYIIGADNVNSSGIITLSKSNKFMMELDGNVVIRNQPNTASLDTTLAEKTTAYNQATANYNANPSEDNKQAMDAAEEEMKTAEQAVKAVTVKISDYSFFTLTEMDSDTKTCWDTSVTPTNQNALVSDVYRASSLSSVVNGKGQIAIANQKKKPTPISITANKNWVGGVPDGSPQIQLILYRTTDTTVTESNFEEKLTSSNQVGDIATLPTSDGKWSYTWTNLEQKNSDTSSADYKKEYHYFVKEDKTGITGYQPPTYDNQGRTGGGSITVYNTPVKVGELKVVKHISMPTDPNAPTSVKTDLPDYLYVDVWRSVETQEAVSPDTTPNPDIVSPQSASNLNTTFDSSFAVNFSRGLSLSSAMRKIAGGTAQLMGAGDMSGSSTSSPSSGTITAEEMNAANSESSPYQITFNNMKVSENSVIKFKINEIKPQYSWNNLTLYYKVFLSVAYTYVDDSSQTVSNTISGNASVAKSEEFNVTIDNLMSVAQQNEWIKEVEIELSKIEVYQGGGDNPDNEWSRVYNENGEPLKFYNSVSWEYKSGTLAFKKSFSDEDETHEVEGAIGETITLYASNPDGDVVLASGNTYDSVQIGPDLDGNQTVSITVTESGGTLKLTDSSGTPYEITVSSKTMSLSSTADITLNPGETKTITVNYPAIVDGSTNVSVTPTNSSKAIATYDSGTKTITFKGLASGRTTFTVKDENNSSITHTINVIVNPMTLGGTGTTPISIFPSEGAITIPVSNPAQDANGNVLASASSSNSEAVTAEYQDGNLIITPVKAGTATVTITDGVTTFEIPVTVNPYLEATIQAESAENQTYNVYVGEPFTITTNKLVTNWDYNEEYFTKSDPMETDNGYVYTLTPKGTKDVDGQKIVLAPNQANDAGGATFTVNIKMKYHPLDFETDGLSLVGTVVLQKYEVSSGVYGYQMTNVTPSGFSGTQLTTDMLQKLPVTDDDLNPYIYAVTEKNLDSNNGYVAWQIDNLNSKGDSRKLAANGLSIYNVFNGKNEEETPEGSSLPTSGGSGTAPYRTAGFLLMMTAVTFPYIKHRNRRKRNSA